MKHKPVCQNCRTPLTGRQTKNCARCKPYVKRAYYREYNRLNAEKKSAAAREWQTTNKERQRKTQREYRKNNADKFRLSRRQHYRKNRLRMVAYFQARRTAELNAESTLTIDEWQETLEGTDGKCVYCGDPWEHQDHFVPLSKGGGFTALNIVPACGACNLRKGSMMPFDYIRKVYKCLPGVAKSTYRS